MAKETKQPPEKEPLFSLNQSGAVSNSVQLGFVDLAGDPRPIANKSYNSIIISASNAALETLPVPATAFKRINIDLLLFYINHLPDFLGGQQRRTF